MERMGLLPRGGWHKSGIGVYVEPGALKGEAEIKDPTRGISGWMKDVLVPTMREHGYTSNADVQQELYRLFGTETGRRMAGLFVQNEAQISRDAALYDQVDPGAAYTGIGANDYAANVQNLGTAIQNFGEAVGSPSVGVAIGYMGAGFRPPFNRRPRCAPRSFHWRFGAAGWSGPSSIATTHG